MGGDIYQHRTSQRVDLRRRNDGTASGIYHCSIPTVAVHDDNGASVREYVYVGLYDSGGQYADLRSIECASCLLCKVISQ